MHLKTSDSNDIKPFLSRIVFPQKKSHKGQNGKLLIIGGSSLFHAASLWSASVASKIVDMVHYSSTTENEKIFLNLKSKFVDGIIIKKKELQNYITEDDCVLIGPGMLRGPIPNHTQKLTIDEIYKISIESDFTYYLTNYLLTTFPNKKFVLDAGALQMLDKNLLKRLSIPAIVTPHAKEFEHLFGISVADKKEKDIIDTVLNQAQKYSCVILLKHINDYISDGERCYIVSGGNAGLTKGGTGDVLAGVVASLNTTNNQIDSSVIGSYLIKKSAEILYEKQHFWFNANDIISTIPLALKRLLDQQD